MKRKLLILLGSLSLALGLLGIALPLLPTTPFLLLSATCYFHGSDRLYRWLMAHPTLGPYIRSFREDKAIPLRAKVVSVTMVWVTLLYCIFFVVNPLWLRILLFLLAIGISWHILSFKTRPSERC
ncbi:MAG: YbaN family protein [Bacteroidaceae bacterium]|nr:YbaN family protein [Bacteroidaceae bacterium]